MQVAAVKNAKRLKYAGVGQRLVQEPVFLSLQPDGSDLWRLEPVIQLLREGGVSCLLCMLHTHFSPSVLTTADTERGVSSTLNPSRTFLADMLIRFEAAAHMPADSCHVARQ